MNWKQQEKKQHNLRCYTRTRPDGLKKTKKTFGIANLGIEIINRGTAEYETTVHPSLDSDVRLANGE
jgi:hypothetical protein